MQALYSIMQLYLKGFRISVEVILEKHYFVKKRNIYVVFRSVEHFEV